MSILRNKQAGRFTQVPNELITNSKGMPDIIFRIIIYLMSRPDNWKVNNSDIMRRHNIKTRDTMGKYWKKIIATGWVSRTPARSRGGTFGGYDYEIHISPCLVQTDTVQDGVGDIRTNSNTDDINNTNNNSNTYFEPPTKIMIYNYLMHKKSIDERAAWVFAKSIFEYYQKNDWSVGKGINKTKMTNWKLAASGWHDRSVKPEKTSIKKEYKSQGVNL